MLPTFLNLASGSAPAILRALRGDHRFAAHEVPPAALAGALRVAVAEGARRLVVAGGDGTVLCAAAAVAGTGVELAVLPGGTLNHFAHDLGLPVDDLRACLDVAAGGVPRPADLGEVNGHWILNSSSIGAYVAFVRTRERLERWLDYLTASVVAALRVLFVVRGLSVEMLHVPSGAERRYRTPLLFVGVGERDLSRASPATRRPGGRRALHALVVRRSTRLRVAAAAWSALMRGIEHPLRAGALDAVFVDELVVRLRRRSVTVAIDGELLRLRPPLHYRLRRDAFTVIVPRER